MARGLVSTAVIERRSKAVSRNGKGPAGAAESSGGPLTLRSEIRLIPISSTRSDGGAQHRIAPDPRIIEEYAKLMRAGVEFPPIPVRFDETDYWPSDGFQRIEAAKLAGFSEIPAEVRPGTREVAQWDSYAANATHGIRRTPAETERIVKLALAHPNATGLSNVQMAKHLHIPLTTLRRWRDKVILATGQDSCIRTVTRGDTTYQMKTPSIEKKKREHQIGSRRDYEAEIADARETASEPTQRILNVFANFVRRRLPPAKLAELVEKNVCNGRSMCRYH